MPSQLWAAIKADGGYTALIREDLFWMYQWLSATTPLPDTTHSWEPWFSCRKLEPGRFRGLLRRVCSLELYRTTVIAASDGLHRGIAAASSAPLPRPGTAGRRVP